MSEVTAIKSETVQGIIDSIEGLKVLELVELIKALEDKFGVVAAPAAVAAAPAGGDAGAPAAAVKDSFDVVLQSCGDKKIKVLKALREVIDIGLKEAKEVVDNVPKTIKEGATQEEADKLKAALEAEGGVVVFE
jgi:large subunit ribosomal protein L7/L12